MSGSPVYGSSSMDSPYPRGWMSMRREVPEAMSVQLNMGPGLVVMVIVMVMVVVAVVVVMIAVVA